MSNTENQAREVVTAPTSLYTIMAQLSGVSFVSFDATTVPKINKTMVNDAGEKVANPHFGRITKKTVGARGLVYQNKNVSGYKNQVEKQMAAEGIVGDFKVGPRKWGVREENLPIVTLRDSVYLEVIFSHSGTSEYLLDGQPINKSEILGMPATKSYGGQGGIEKQIIIRTFDVESLDEVRVFGKTFTNVTK